jgi:NADH-quinone oxidoreductase subunit A
MSRNVGWLLVPCSLISTGLALTSAARISVGRLAAGLPGASLMNIVGGIALLPRMKSAIQYPAESSGSAALWPLAVYFAAVIVLVVAMLALSYVLGERHKQRATGEPYESGMLPTGSARLRLSVKFYLVAMFFVIFDLETIFIFAWAVAFRELGWIGYAEVLFFIGVLFAALVYLWRIGALDWGTTRRKFVRSEKE